ncbi:MAG: rhodanese-like domain-containing protein, partial [Flavobacteriaceae bacterium]|nr:rhodanese-like domain-containing protein [Flavobacteriaceae bacterium]
MNEINLSKLITGILAIVIVIIGITGLLKIDFTAEKFQKTPKEVQEQLLKKEYLINIENIHSKDSINQYVFVDLRNQSDFENGHLNNALHVFASQILEKEPLKLFRKIEKDGKTIVLYSSSPLETNSSWYLLTKLGFENIKILNAKTAFVNNVFEVTPFNSENLPIDIAGYIKQSNEVKMEPAK